MFNPHPEFFDVEGLGYIVESTGPLGRECRARRVETGQHDDLTFRMQGPHLLEHRQAVGTRHDDVQQHDIGCLVGHLLDGLICGHGFENAKGFVKDHLQGLSDPRLIVYD